MENQDFLTDLYFQKKSVSVFLDDGKSLQKDHNLKSLIYSFDITSTAHGKTFNWTINKLYSEFQQLDRDIRIFYHPRPLGHHLMPKLFTVKHEQQQLITLENYIRAIYDIPRIKKSPIFWEFIEVSEISFLGTSIKRKEGYIYKRTGGRIGNELRFCNCKKYFRRYQKRWLIIRDNMVGYLASNTKSNLLEVLVFKGKFKVFFGKPSTGHNDGIIIETSNRKLKFRAGSVMRMKEWVQAINEAYANSEWTSENMRFESSFPIRHGNEAKWYIDAEEYFSDVYDELKKAKREVFISDWWLSPELYLKRPAKLWTDSQVYEVLGSLADRGVKIFIHVYKEVSFALNLNSLHTKNTIISRNPNIQIVRHPHRSVVGGEFLWTHHEKLVVIDQEVAFVGGLDMCFGRFDNQSHKLTDLNENPTWPGIDYSNVRISEYQDVDNWNRDLINRKTTPRMPWHDIALKVSGKAASDVALHFIELWNHVMTDITGNYCKDKNLLEPPSCEKVFLKNVSTIVESPKIQVSSVIKNQEDQEEAVFDTKRRSKTYGPVSCTTMNEINLIRHKSVGGAHKRKINVENLMFSMSLPDRHPSHGKVINVLKVPTTPEIQRHLEKKDNEENFLLRPSSSANNIDNLFSSSSHEQLEHQDEQKEYDYYSKDKNEAWDKNILQPKIVEAEQKGTCECQLTRSAGLWSLGLEKSEHSIHTAYIHLIDMADHFIYIENQFFISSTGGSLVKNQIAQALVERIKVAAARHEKFLVVVVLPLLPGFEGSVSDSGAAVLRVQLHWEYETICRSSSSLLKQLADDPNIKDPSDYIRFYGLRTHDLLENTPVTELVYAHSKLMIIDDDIALIGSANINDRSLLGTNDSELAMIIDDNDKVSMPIGSEEREVSRFAHSLRVSLYSEYLGVDYFDDRIQNPTSEECLELWNITASHNTKFYRKVFRCYPDDKILKIKEIETFAGKANLEAYENERHKSKGILCNFPLKFLENEKLQITVFNREFIIPEESFV
ncbi:unnamed protein product [Blepharisma stoltei]|uniref:Phospholipase n=1 Tax=Blepharisma stoltei TaxID=1481888 RepID=A0AAU9JDM5_9CILI|nr:unnamed protein product [Blepharisma stoltei]